MACSHTKQHHHRKAKPHADPKKSYRRPVVSGEVLGMIPSVAMDYFICFFEIAYLNEPSLLGEKDSP